MRSTLLLCYLALLIGCQSNEQKSANHQVAKESEKITQNPSTDSPDIFQNAFQEGFNYEDADLSYTFQRLPIGKLKVETGKIIATDPFFIFDAIAFEHQFPIGSFPVDLALAKAPNMDKRVAFSRICFTDSTPIKWEFALLPNEKPIPLNSEDIYCFTVDAGIGVFIDSAAAKVVDQFSQQKSMEAFSTRHEQHDYIGYTYVFDQHNFAAFTTGLGDGCYATYLGFDKSGQVCQLISDFGLIPWWEKVKN